MDTGTVQCIVGWAVIFLGLYLWEHRKNKKIKTHQEESIADHVARINEVSNEKKTVLLLGNTVTCNVAGVTFEEHQDTIETLQKNDGVLLKRDKANVHDSNAIEIYAYKRVRRKTESIGFIPMEIVAVVANYFDEFTIPQVSRSGKVINISQLSNGVKSVEIKFSIPDELA